MGGGPTRAIDYSRGHSALRIADSHRYEVDEKHGYWRNEVEGAVLRHVADRHEADVAYDVGDEGGLAELDYVCDLGFDVVRYVPGNHDSVSAETAHGHRGTVIADDVMAWRVSDGSSEYRVAMAHDPRRFGLRLGTDTSTHQELYADDGDLYDLVITGHSHFPRHHQINHRTVADHAGSLKRNFDPDDVEPERAFASPRFYNSFPDPLRAEIPQPDRSFAVITFDSGITIHRYDADELAEAYVEPDSDIDDVGPDAEFFFDTGARTSDLPEAERRMAMTD